MATHRLRRRRRRGCASPSRCEPTASSTPSRTASSAATSCASRCSRPSSPTTSPRSPTPSTSWSTRWAHVPPRLSRIASRSDRNGTRVTQFSPGCDSIGRARLATIRTRHGTRAVCLDDDALVELAHDDVGELLAPSPTAIAAAARSPAPRHELDAADFAPVVSIPGRSSASASTTRTTSPRWAASPPEHPTLFAKFTDALIGAHDDIVLPRASAAGRLGSRARGGDRHARSGTRRRARGGRGDRRLHGGQRRLDARLAEPHACNGSRARRASTPRRSARGW